MELRQNKCSLRDNIYRILFIATVVLSLFNWADTYLPSVVKALLVNESMAAIYPAMILTVLIFIDNCRSKRLGRYRYLLCFFIAYFIVNTVVSIHSIATFRFADEAVYDNLEGGPKYAYLFIRKLFPSFSEFSAFAVSFVIRTEINIFREFIFSWLVVYSVALYLVDNRNAWKCFLYGLYGAVGIIAFYGVFEIANKMGYSWGTKFLEKVNPWLYPVGTIHGWYPPLFFGSNMLRSVFAEGGFFAYWGCLALPFLLNEICRGRRLNAIPVIILVANLIGSESRSATVMLAAEVCVFVVFSLILNWKNGNFWLMILSLVVAVALGMMIVGSDGFASRNSTASVETMVDEEGNIFDVEKASLLGSEAENMLESGFKLYMSRTFSSLGELSMRSNISRYGLFDSRMKIWLDHPVLGVGKELSGYYLLEKAEEYPYYNSEIDNWCTLQREEGALTNVFSGLDIYSQILAYGGVFGFLIEIGPLVLILILLLISFISNRRKRNDEGAAAAVVLLSAIVAVLIFGVSNSLSTVPLYYVVTGIAIGVIMKDRAGKKEKQG